jgi:hypothetical protein
MSQSTCEIQDCGRPVKSQGWCNAHYQRWLKDGDPGAGRPLRYSLVQGGQCAVEGCGEPVKAKGWCGRHYERQRRHGDLLADTPGRPGKRLLPCKVPDCTDLATGGYGWCKRHHQRWYKHGDPLAGKEYTRRGAPLRERIEARVTKAAHCWFWLGPLDELFLTHHESRESQKNGTRVSKVHLCGRKPRHPRHRTLRQNRR